MSEPLLMLAGYTVMLGAARIWGRHQREKLLACYEILKKKHDGHIKRDEHRSVAKIIFGPDDPIFEIKKDGLRVEVSHLPKQGTLIQIFGDLPKDIQISRETAISSARKLLGHHEPKVGQAAFDEAVFLEGDSTQLLSYLGRQARRDVMTCLDRGARLHNGIVSLQLDARVTDPDVLSTDIEQLLAMASSLRRRERGQPSRLAENVRTDTNRVVRENCLDALYAHYGDLALTADLTTELLQDRSATIRLMAARKAGKKGNATLEQLVNSENAPQDVRVSAFLLFLQRSTDTEDVQRVVQSALRGKASLMAAALSVAHTQSIILDAQLLDHSERSDDPQVLEALAKYCHPARDRDAVPRLARLLGSNIDSVMMSASIGLRQFGTPAVVPSLRDAMTQASPNVRATLEDTVLTIQSRVCPDMQGGLELVNSAEGQLSVAKPIEPGARGTE